MAPSRPAPDLMIPPSAMVTMAATRRSLLRGAALGGALLGSSSLLAACGGDDGGGGSASGSVKFGMNEAKGSGPAYTRLDQVAKAYAKKAGVEVKQNAVDHNTFQENINTYLQGNPDDVFTWFAGYRMQQFAEQGLISDVSDAWPIDGMADSFKAASTSDGKQYFVPVGYYPWAVFYRKSIWEQKGYAPPANLDELTTLMKKMQTDGLVPFGFADKEGWPAMGTFDILNMRINGYDFHINLMKGEEDWDSSEVKQVFDTWRGLLPYHQSDPLGRTWQEAATSLGNGETGMYLLGTFVVDGIPDLEDDLDFFTFPELDSSIGATALDAPIDGFCLAAGGKNQAGGKKMMAYLGSAEAADAANKDTTPLIAANSKADTSGYSALQTKSAEVVSQATQIAQFLDRDTRADFASTVVIPSLQSFLKDPDDIDGVTKSLQQQKESIFSS